MYKAYFNFSEDHGKRRYSAEGNLDDIAEAIYNEFPERIAHRIDSMLHEDSFMNMTCAFEDVSVEIYRRDGE